MNRIVVITGCSSGIGNALAKAFKHNGDTVVATARNINSLQELKAIECITLPLDVNSESSQTTLKESLEKEFSCIDILINNAGISAMGPMSEMPSHKLRNQFETNVFAPILLTQKLLPLLEKSNNPYLINVGSISATLVTPFAGAYCASKAALNCVTEALRLELAPFGINVLAVQPGAIKSNFGEAASQSVTEWLSDQSKYQKIKQGIYARAQASQKNATPAEEFATQLLATIDNHSGSQIHIGKGSRVYPIIANWLPEKLRTHILSRRFSLDKL